MQFESIIGQTRVKQQLLDTVKNQRQAHAVLILGAEGTGAFPLAVALAQYISCDAPTEHDSCGVCKQCTRIAKLAHPDLHIALPVIKSDDDKKKLSKDYYADLRMVFEATPYFNDYDWITHLNRNYAKGLKNGRQGNISIAECHQIIRQLSLKSFEGGKKIQLIFGLEYLKEAGNSLLKAIEEPTDDTIFIMVAEDRDSILNTILSRSQIFQTTPLAPNEIAEALAKKGIAALKAEDVARASFGNFRRAEQLCADEDTRFSELFEQLLRLVSSKIDIDKGKATVQLVDTLAGLGREPQKGFLQYCSFVLEQALKASYLPFDSDSVTVPKALLAIDRPELYEQWLALFSKAYYYVERNANAKILFMNILLRFEKIYRQKDKVKI